MSSKSRTDILLEKLGVPSDFRDPDLPSEVFSHSQYSSHRTCGEAYRFKYIERVRTPNYPATTKGSAAHAGIEKLLRQKLDGQTPDLVEAIGITEQVFDEKAQLVEKWDPDLPASKIKEDTLAIIKHFGVYALPQVNPKEIELGFAKKMGDVPMIGYIDMVEEVPAVDVSKMAPEEAALAPRKEVAVDWKTSAKKWSEAQVRLSTQMTAYAHVRGTPHVRIDQLVNLKAGVNYVRAESTRSQEDIDIFVDDLNSVVRDIKAGNFPKAPIDHWACNEKYCSFWALCRGRKKA